MEAKEGLADLANFVSFPKLVKIAPKTSDLLSTHRTPQNTYAKVFRIDGLGGLPLTNQANVPLKSFKTNHFIGYETGFS